MFINTSRNGKEFHTPNFMMHRCLYAPGSESRLMFIDDYEKQSFTGGMKYSAEWLEEVISKKYIPNKCTLPFKSVTWIKRDNLVKKLKELTWKSFDVEISRLNQSIKNSKASL